MKKKFYIKQYLFLTIGTFVSAIGINLFLVPHELVAGGISGFSLFLNYLTPFSTSFWLITLNIPIFILGWKILGKNFFFASLFGMLMLSLFLHFTDPISKIKLLSDPLLASVFSGVLRGIGIGMTLRVSGSQGGTDIIGAIIHKKYSMSIGQVSMFLNVAIVILAGLVLGADIAALAIVSIFVESVMMDKTVKGINTSVALFIISNEPRLIADQMLKKLDRGVTFLHGEGAYYGNTREVIYCVVSLRQLAKAKHYVKDIDANAFIAVADVSEVLGRGFRPSPF